MRGASSLKGSNEPLVIIDGMPGNMTSLNAIAPEDIEAIDVLKDGSAAAISAINAENQQIAKQTPNFTPKNVKLGVFVFFKIDSMGR